MPGPTPEQNQALVGKKFDCDVCGATVGGEWLQTHANWHAKLEEGEAKCLANPDRVQL